MSAHSPFIRIFPERDGVALIEFAVILPVLLIIVLGVMEYGWYYMNAMEASRQVTLNAQRINADPETAQRINLTGGVFKGALCAQAYPNIPSAEAAAKVTCGEAWNIARPKGNNHYAVLVQAHGTYQSLTGLMEALVPSQIGAQQILDFGRIGCDLKSYMEHTGCRLHYYQQTYQCKNVYNSSNILVEGPKQLLYTDTYSPICKDGRLVCNWNNRNCSPGQRDCNGGVAGSNYPVGGDSVCGHSMNSH